MFLGVRFTDNKGTDYIEPINVCHVIRLAYIDIKNVDAGVYLHMRNGDVLPTPETMDILAPKIEAVWKEAAQIVLTQLAFEVADQDIEKKRKPRKRK